MELIMINDKKMKIMLTEKELYRYNLECGSFSMESEDQRHAFRKVLSDACKMGGFDNRSSRLMVQMYPSKKGGCEIFVTKMESTDQECKKALPPSPIVVGIDCGEMSCEGKDSLCTECYCFNNFSHLITVCKQLLICKYSGSSNAYVSPNGTYYLVLSDISITSTNKSYDMLSFIGEYAKRSDIRALGYIEDHCKSICKRDAVSTLGRL